MMQSFSKFPKILIYLEGKGKPWEGQAINMQENRES